MNDNGNGGQDALGRAEFLAMMATVPLGRVVFTNRALPAIQLVNFVLDDNGDVILRSDAGSKLAAGLRGAIVAFETDDLDPATATGWYVTVIGRARHVTDPAEVVRLRRLRLKAWAPGPHNHFIRIVPPPRLRAPPDHVRAERRRPIGAPAAVTAARRSGAASGDRSRRPER
jgi:hypothetical protein